MIRIIRLLSEVFYEYENSLEIILILRKYFRSEGVMHYSFSKKLIQNEMQMEWALFRKETPLANTKEAKSDRINNLQYLWRISPMELSGMWTNTNFSYFVGRILRLFVCTFQRRNIRVLCVSIKIQLQFQCLPKLITSDCNFHDWNSWNLFFYASICRHIQPSSVKVYSPWIESPKILWNSMEERQVHE